jgi:hypothetical protein
MVLLALPYPPLPVLAGGVLADDGRLHDERVTHSHTFIAKCLNEAAVRADSAANRVRFEHQKAAMHVFMHRMGTEGFFCAPERLYQIFCEGTLHHIATYFPPEHALDVRFLPFDYVTRGDPIHAKMAEYLAAQSILLEDSPPVPRSVYLAMSFGEQLLSFRDRFGHAMTEEERQAVAGEGPAKSKA